MIDSLATSSASLPCSINPPQKAKIESMKLYSSCDARDTLASFWPAANGRCCIRRWIASSTFSVAMINRCSCCNRRLSEGPTKGVDCAPFFMHQQGRSCGRTLVARYGLFFLRAPNRLLRCEWPQPLFNLLMSEMIACIELSIFLV